MPYQFTLPQLSAETEEGIVVAWFKREGAEVQEGERLLEVQLAKVSYDIPAPISGRLYRILAPREGVIRQGQILALILEPGEAMPIEEEKPVAKVTEAAPSPQPFVLAWPAARRLARDHGIDLSQVQGSDPEGRVTERDVLNFIAARQQPREVRASPLARRLAQEHGLDLTQVRGSGADGRITEADVRAGIAARATTIGVKIEPLTPMRKTIARRMAESLQTMAQVTLVSEADVTDLVTLRETLKQQFDLAYTDLIVKAVALALTEHPYLNARLVGEEIHLLPDINIGVAVSVEAGLIVPVVRNVSRKSLREIAMETKALAERAREGKLVEKEMTEGTFTVTNLGIYGIDAFTPIINPPEAAILGVGRIIEKATKKSKRGGVLWRQMTTLSLTFDHRVVDGAPAAVFLQAVRAGLENPTHLAE